MKALKGGKVFVDGDLKAGDLGFEEKIQRIGGEIRGEEIDVFGKIIIPALSDVHVHFRDFNESHKETIESGSRAAVKGGVGKVMDMPNNQPPAITLAMIREKRKRAAKTPINYFVYGGVHKKNLDAIPLLAKEVDAFKLYMGKTTGGLVISDHQLQKEIFKTVATTGLILTVHTQFTKGSQGNQESKKQLEMLERTLDLATRYENRLHLAHISTRSEVETLIPVKNELDLTVETCPHYLVLTEEDLGEKGSLLKVNPPLAREEDRGFLWEAIQDELIDIVASDHAPHTLKEKSRSMDSAPAGLPGVETLLPVMLDCVVRGRISLDSMLKVCSYNPSKRFGLGEIGAIEIGHPADLVVVDLKKRRVSNDDLATKCGWSPYGGMELAGWPEMTFLDGHKVYPKG